MHVAEGNDGAGRPAAGVDVTRRGCRPAAARRGFGRRRPTGRRPLLTLVLLVAVSTAASGCRPPACTEPFPAAMWQEDVPRPAPWPEGGPDRPTPSSQLDADGDGMVDTVDGALAVTVHRANGLRAMVLADDTPNEVILRADGAELHFTTANSGLTLTQADFDRVGASIVDGPDGAAWLVVWIAGDGGRVTSRWAWDLDALCDGPTSPAMKTGGD